MSKFRIPKSERFEAMNSLRPFTAEKAINPLFLEKSFKGETNYLNRTSSNEKLSLLKLKQIQFFQGK